MDITTMRKENMLKESANIWIIAATFTIQADPVRYLFNISQAHLTLALRRLEG